MLYSDKTVMGKQLQSPSPKKSSLFARMVAIKPASWGSLLFIMILTPYCCYKIGYSRGNPSSLPFNEDISSLKETIEQLQSENLRFKEELSVAQRNYQIQLEAKKNLAEYLKTLQQHNAELSQSMALYQSVTSKTSGDLKPQIRAFYLFPTASLDTFRYSVMLSKSSGTEYIQGVVTMAIKGMIGEKSITLTVKYLDSNRIDGQIDGRNDGLAFKFRHFQELTGELALPESFIPEEVTVKVLSDKGGSPIVQHFPWIVAG